MKRSRSPSPTRGGIFSSSPSRREDPQNPPEKKIQINLKEVIEQEPYAGAGGFYIVRKTRLGQKLGSLTLELEKSMDKYDTSILEIALDRLNELRERAPLNQRQPRLSIKLKQDPKNDYVFNVTATKKEDMATFIDFLAKERHISKKTAKGILNLYEHSDEPLSPSKTIAATN